MNVKANHNPTHWESRQDVKKDIIKVDVMNPSNIHRVCNNYIMTGSGLYTASIKRQTSSSSTTKEYFRGHDKAVVLIKI